MRVVADSDPPRASGARVSATRPTGPPGGALTGRDRNGPATTADSAVIASPPQAFAPCRGARRCVAGPDRAGSGAAGAVGQVAQQSGVGVLFQQQQVGEAATQRQAEDVPFAPVVGQRELVHLAQEIPRALAQFEKKRAERRTER